VKLLNEFYAFMRERETIRLRRRAGLPRDQWTTDPIMRTYSFTNVKREHDRTTVGLLPLYRAHLWIHAERSPETMRALMLNCALYRYFGTVEMATAIGWVQEWTEEQSSRIQQLADDRMLLGETVFTSAYIVPNCGSTLPKHTIVCQIMGELWDALPEVLSFGSWKLMCDRLCEIWGVGPFMAKEILLDYILATEWEPNDWLYWTPVGPGGKRGASRVAYGAIENVTPDEAIGIIREIYAVCADHWRHDLFDQSVVGAEPIVELALTDIQFQLCEFDKYSRVAEGRKPKRNFRPTVDNVTRDAK